MPSTTPLLQRPSYRRALSSYTSKNKPRLYIALYPRSASSSQYCDAHHWVLLVAPPTSSRSDPGTRYHFAHSSALQADRKQSVHTFFYEREDLAETESGNKVLCRVAVAKVLDPALAAEVLRGITPKEGEEATYTCFAWVQEAFAKLHESGALKSYFGAGDWREVEKITREYVREKRAQGRFVEGAEGEVPTYNAWQYRETTT